MTDKIIRNDLGNGGRTDANANTGTSPRYVGRFAPSPTGPLHAGSLAAALASWLDARAFCRSAATGHTGATSTMGRGQWLVRIEDTDLPRCVPGADQFILGQLAACGLVPDAPPVWQSQRGLAYQQALDGLIAAGLAYPCGCSRKNIEDAWAAQGVVTPRHAAAPYPGTCRSGPHGRTTRAWRLRTDFYPSKTPPAAVFTTDKAITNIAPKPLFAPFHWTDRRLGHQQQDIGAEVGDFVLRRADGLWAYQLAVVIDDALQGITHVVRGADLADNTPRQILLQQALGLPTPQYLHTPLVCGADGQKLSKQNGAAPLDLHQPLLALYDAARVLGLPTAGVEPAAQVAQANLAVRRPTAAKAPVGDALAYWVAAWAATYNTAHI